MPTANDAPDAGAQLTVGLASHESVAVVEYVTTAPAVLVHAVERFAGQVIVGAVESRTVTVNEQVREFAGTAWSLAVQLTVVVPTPNVDPDAGAQLTEGLASQVSVAVTVKLTVAKLGPVHSVVRLDEHVIVGAVESRTVTVKEHEADVFGGEA